MEKKPYTISGLTTLALYAAYVTFMSMLSVWLNSTIVAGIQSVRPGLKTLDQILAAPIPIPSTFNFLMLEQDRPFTSPFLGTGFVAVILSFFMRPDLACQVCSWIGARWKYVLACVFASMVAATYGAYHAYPLAMDEFIPEFQAMIFESGHWIAQWPRQVAMGNPHRYHFFAASPATGNVMSAYWPGYALVKTPFMAMGISPWLNPLLAVAFGWIMVKICRGEALALDDGPDREETTGWVLLLSFATASFWLHAVSFYAYMGIIACNALVLILASRGTRNSLFAAGCVGGLGLALVNPMPHLLFAIPVVAWSVFRDRWNSRHLIYGYLCTGIPLVFVWPVLVFMVLNNVPLTLHAWVNVLVQGSWIKDLMGRGWSGAPLFETNVTTAFKHELWTFPGFTFFALAGLWMARGKAIARVCLVQTVLVIFFYMTRVRFNQGFGWGARYLVALWPCFILGLFFLIQRVRRVQPRVMNFIFVCAMLSVLVLVPARLFQAEALIWRQMSADPCREMKSGELCVVIPRDGHSTDYVRPLPFLADGKIRVSARTRAEELFLANQLLRTPFRKTDSWMGSIWATGVTPATSIK